MLAGAALLTWAIGALAAPADAGKGPPRCFGQEATIYKPDVKAVEGTNKADVIVTAGGKNQINGNGGDDLICSGGNKDIVRGGPGGDRISGQGGGDLLIGGGGDDELRGRRGLDVIDGKSGRRDVCIGGKGNDLASRKGCEVIKGAITS